MSESLWADLIGSSSDIRSAKLIREQKFHDCNELLFALVDEVPECSNDLDCFYEWIRSIDRAVFWLDHRDSLREEVIVRWPGFRGLVDKHLPLSGKESLADCGLGLRYTLKYEWLTDRKPWVAKLTLDGNRIVYDWQRGQVDYIDTNGAGSRWTYLYYHLTDGVYHVGYFTSWRGQVKKYIQIINGDCHDIEKTQVHEAIKGASGDGCADSSKAANQVDS